MSYLQLFNIYWLLLKTTNVSFKLVLASAFLIGLASIFQMTGLGLVVPVLNALIDETQFRGIITAPVLGDLIKFLPFQANNNNIFVFMIFLIFFAVVLENACILAGRYFSLKVEKHLDSELRIKLFNKFINFNKGFFAHQEANELNTLLTHYVPSASRTCNNITLLLTQFFFTIVFIVLMFVISWKLTLLALILLPLIHLLANKFTHLIKSSAQKAQEELVSMANQADDVFNNISLVQLSVNEQEEQKKFARTARSVSTNNSNARLRGYCVPAIVDIMNAAGALIIVAASIFIFFTFDSYSLGRLLVFFVALRRFISNSQQFTSTLVQSAAEMPGLEMIVEALNIPDPDPLVSGEKSFPSLKNEIEFKDVSFYYNQEQPVLSNVNLKIPVKSLVAIVGPSGAGKTSLVNLIPRFYDPQKGSVLMDNNNIKEYSLQSLRNRVSLVSQNTMLFNSSIKDNITYGLKDVSDQDFRKALELAQFSEFVDSLPMKENTLVGNKGSKLSGGEIQRLCIARAILADSEILILDEPTSALDAVTERKLDLALDAVIPNRTVFVIAHRLITVKKATEIIFLEDGEIKEHGSFDQLIAEQGRFYEFSKLQNLFN